MKSMTGYGRGEACRAGCKVTVEISAVNRRQAEISLRLPPECEPLEARVRDELNRHVARGRLTVRVSLHRSAEQWAATVRVNAPLAKAYARELGRLGRELKLPQPVSLDALLRIPGVVESTVEESGAEAFWPSLEAALLKAVASLVKMREREGAHLAKELKARVATMRRLTANIAKHSPAVARRYRDQLLERIRQAGLPLAPEDDDRILKEVVFFADRSDISEELSRLQSHYGQFDDCGQATEPVGRMLDFLAQEINREVNTIGSKANDSVITQVVVQLKAELEKFREQVQNVE